MSEANDFSFFAPSPFLAHPHRGSHRQKDAFPNEQTRFVAEKLLGNDRVKSVLNIGYRYDSDHSVREALLAAGKTFSVLEGYKPNCEAMTQNTLSKMEIFNLDVRDISKIGKHFDAIIWLHGPEHLPWEEFRDTVRHKVEAMADVFTLYQAPIGPCPQDEIYGNPFEKHQATLTGEMFRALDDGKRYEITNHDQNGEWTFSALVGSK